MSRKVKFVVAAVVASLIGGTAAVAVTFRVPSQENGCMV